MTTTNTVKVHASHPLARGASIDAGIVLISAFAILLTFLTGQREADWQNVAFPPLVLILALVVMRLVYAEIVEFRRTAGDTPHKATAALELVVALAAMVVVGPMIVIMPFIFFGALT